MSEHLAQMQQILLERLLEFELTWSPLLPNFILVDALTHDGIEILDRDRGEVKNLEDL